MKKVIIFILILVMILTACENTSGYSKEEKEVYNALLEYFFSSFEDYRNTTIVSTMIENFEYEIKNISVIGDKATIKVHIKILNIEYIMLLFEEKGYKPFEDVNLFIGFLNDNLDKTIERDMEIDFIKVNGKWIQDTFLYPLDILTLAFP